MSATRVVQAAHIVEIIVPMLKERRSSGQSLLWQAMLACEVDKLVTAGLHILQLAVLETKCQQSGPLAMTNEFAGTGHATWRTALGSTLVESAQGDYGIHTDWLANHVSYMQSSPS